jgi:hypothetical protein
MKEALERDGFALWPGRLDEAALRELAGLFDRLDSRQPGLRIDPAQCDDSEALRMIGPMLRDLLGPEARPVRALLFDKSDSTNWSLGWHQDRTIEVSERLDVPGYGPWTVKQGRLHAAPPIALIERMLTVRIHLDLVPEDNAPLQVAPGSHRLGFIAETAIENVLAQTGTATCLAAAGTIWLYATPILHRSLRSSPGQRRRVLQMDIAAIDLPDGLRWAADEHRRALEGAPALA